MGVEDRSFVRGVLVNLVICFRMFIYCCGVIVLCALYIYLIYVNIQCLII